MTTIYLIRHPETPPKLAKQDHSTRLGKEGARVAHQIAHQLAKHQPHRIYSSEYLRAQTAAFTLRYTLGAENHSVVVDPLFNEIGRPLVDGQPFSSLNSYFWWRKQVIHFPTGQNIRSRFKNTGESYWELLLRVQKILQLFSQEEYQGQSIAVYTHSQVIAMTKTAIELWPYFDDPREIMELFNQNFPRYGSITTLQRSIFIWKVTEFNNTSHLK